MVELVSDEPCKRGLLHHIGPIEKQVVIVEDVVALLCFHVATKELLQFTFPFRAPSEPMTFALRPLRPHMPQWTVPPVARLPQPPPRQSPRNCTRTAMSHIAASTCPRA